ncbi:opioid growth factor receptor [Phyllopteryx taeniolatus]|uniref:opioid growth factor receptor n=1 Tax=Phyllopteryx taeniolatus TaxID=161469 RepID=UPI002AD5121B|nr:opioid growth factor receptor [Phyllopteryx taeniolatus]
MEDDCVCEYDSTWDTESDGEEPAGDGQPRRSRTLVSRHHPPRNMRAAKDMQNYRRGYPNLADDECSEDKMNNLQFYLNKFPSAPDEVYIESFLKEWKNDYKRLERVHSYIQWLFPLREPGVNYMASELTKKEIEAFKRNEDAKRRLVESYELMLGFYGIRLVNKEIGEVTRAENWKERFGNLERNMHNNLRITRILKSLGELGFEHYQAPLVHFFLEETLVKKNLSSVKRSVLDYFLFAVLDKQKRQELVRFAFVHFEPKDKFVWCPRKIQKQFRKAEKRSEAVGNGDGKDDIYSRAKSKDGEKGVHLKEEELDNAGMAQKQTETNCDKIKQPEMFPHPKADETTAGNGNSESNNSSLGNSNDSIDDIDEMDQSPTPDTVTVKTEPSADIKFKLTNSSLDAIQEPDSVMQTDEDMNTEKPPKKKREDNSVMQSSGSTADGSAGDAEEKAGGDTAPGQRISPAQTPLKTSKHSHCLSSGREEKIPKTDFTQLPDNERKGLHANGSTHKAKDELTTEKVEDVDMESNPSSLDPNVGNT